MDKKISFYSAPFPSVNSYYKMIDLAVEYGLPAVEAFCINELRTPNLEEARKLKAYADSKGIVFSCLSVYIDVTGDDRAEKIEKLKSYADVAAILGTPFLHHTITPEFSDAAKVISRKEELFNLGVEAVREVYDYAEKIGVKTIFEDQGFLFNGVEGFGRFLSEVDREVGVVADFGNIYQSADSIEDFIKAFSDRVCHVHLKDVIVTEDRVFPNALPRLPHGYMNERPMGEGSIDFKSVIALLTSAGYDGYYSIEYGLKEENKEALSSLLTLVRSWF